MRTIELTYPVARRDDTTDDYFGTEVADPYRWLEDDRSDETVRWVAAENEVTRRYLSQFPERDRIAARLAELWDYPKYGIPERHGDSRFFFENDGLRNQSVLYRQRDGKGPEVFLDPNTLSEEGTVALTGVSFSRDNRYMAFSAAESGSDWVELRIKELATGDLLPDRIRWVKFSGAVWSGDGFYYSGYDRPAPEKALSACNHSQKVFFHRIGTDQSADRTIYCDEEHPLRYLTAAVSRDDRQLFVTVAEGTCGNEVLYRDLSRHDRTFSIRTRERRTVGCCRWISAPVIRRSPNCWPHPIGSWSRRPWPAGRCSRITSIARTAPSCSTTWEAGRCGRCGCPALGR